MRMRSFAFGIELVYVFIRTYIRSYVTHSGKYFFVADRLIFDRLHATLHVRPSVAFYLRLATLRKARSSLRFNENENYFNKSVNVSCLEKTTNRNEGVRVSFGSDISG